MVSPVLIFGQTNITDIQKVNPQGSTDASPLLGLTVTVRGVVTASAEEDNLGIVYIQQPGVTEWAGIRVITGDAPSLLSLVVGHRVVVTGRVAEQNGRTGLDNVQIDSIQGMDNIAPIDLAPDVLTNFTLADNERYESMLVRLAADDELIRVVDVNPDGPFNNFAEWRVGIAPGSPDDGCRILTGRINSTAASSLNVSYINDILWATNDGNLLVDPIVVTTDTAFEAITGIVDYSFGNLKLLPRNNGDFVRPGGSVAVGQRSAIISNTRLYPNPVYDAASIDLTLVKPGYFAVMLYDVKGRLARPLVANRRYQGGINSIPLPNVDAIPPGNYFLAITGPTGTDVLTMLKQ